MHSELDVRAESALVPEDDDNLAVKAAKLLRETTGTTAGVDLAIRKVIPVAGGMAGGSADAAAALVACNDAWGTGLSRAELEQIAAELGSDVPFLLHGGNAIGGGRGETISPVLARGSYHWVFAMAYEGLSTKAVYAEFDRINEGSQVQDPVVPDALLAALRAGDAEALGDALSNDLTEAALSLAAGAAGHARDRHRGRCPGRDPVRLGPDRVVPCVGRAAQPRHRVRPQQRLGMRRRGPVPRPRGRSPHHQS